MHFHVYKKLCIVWSIDFCYCIGVLARSVAMPLGMKVVVRSFPASGTFFREAVTFGHENISTAHSSSSADSRRVVVSKWRKNVR